MNIRSALLLALTPALACATGTGSADDGDSGTSQGGTVSQGPTASGSAQGGATTTGSAQGGAAQGGGAQGGGAQGGGNGCPEGSEPSGNGCVDIDECLDGTDNCDPQVTCTNQDPGFGCGPCPAGTTDINGDGSQCDDVDECINQTDNCDPLAECFNDEPGFHCGPCPNGTTDTFGDGTLCTAASTLIGLDDRHGFSTSDSLGTGVNHTQFRSTITGAGKTVVALNNLDAANLVGLQAVFVQQPYSSNSSPLSASEVSAMVAFVNAGGGLVVFGDGGGGGNQANLNTLATNWGVTFSSTAMWPSGLVVSSTVAHPVTAGVSSFGLDYGVPMTVTAPSTALNLGTDVVLAAATGSGTGNVVFLSDGCFNNSSGSDYNINSLSNALLLSNIVDFVAP